MCVFGLAFCKRSQFGLGLIHVLGFFRGFAECVRNFLTRTAPFLALQHLFYFSILRICRDHIKIRTKSGLKGSLWLGNSSSLNPGPVGWGHIKRPFPEVPLLCLSQAPFCGKLVFQDRNRQAHAPPLFTRCHSCLVYFWSKHIFAPLEEPCRVLPPPSIRGSVADSAHFPHSETWLQISRGNAREMLPKVHCHHVYFGSSWCHTLKTLAFFFFFCFKKMGLGNVTWC